MTNRTTIDIGLLGPVEAFVDRHEAVLGGAKQRALLALLALEAGRAFPADELVEELWDGRPPATAEKTLYSYVSRLRRALGRDAVPAHAGAYVLQVDRAQVDVHRFDALLADGRDAAARGACGLAADRLRAALALWRGRALSDVHHGGRKLAAAARRLDELRLACLEELFNVELALGRHDAIVPELQALVEQEPLRERVRGQLMLALYRCGRQAEALDEYRAATLVLREELGLEPGVELRELERAILRHEVETVVSRAERHNLPTPTTSFVGRKDELARVETRLRRHRLVTVTGLGGSGKTRLALELARRQIDAWSDGVWLVDLTAVADSALVAPTVAQVVGIDDVEMLVSRLRTRELLLVLDNCEHLVDACAELVASLLSACPNIRVLATSRVALAIAGECDVALEPLDEEDATTLFVDRATAIRDDVAAGAGAMEVVGEICRELDRMPLAIELAAARAKALSLGEIAERLDDRFRFLRAWQRVADPRHRTLETTMDWSYELLDDGCRELLADLSVFAGGATLDSVAVVCLDGDRDRATEVIGRLVDASLVRADAEMTTRYRLLETVRQYAQKKLDDDAVRRRHAEHFIEVAEAANLAIDAVARGPQNHAPVLREQHNIRAAIDWATTADVRLALELMLSLENFWVTHAVQEGRRRWEEILPRAAGVDVHVRARAALDYASCLDVLQDWNLAEAAYRRCQDLFVEAGDDVGAAYLDYRIGIVGIHRDGDFDRVQELYACALERLRGKDDVSELQVQGDLGWIMLRRGDPERGREMMAASVERAQSLGWHWWQVQSQAKLAEWEARNGNLDEAERVARECLPVAFRIGDRGFTVLVLAVLARVAAARGDADRALALWSTVEAADESPGRFARIDRAEYGGTMPAGLRPAPLPLEEAVALALSL